MTWVSRIQTERQRQIVIAIIMGVLLAAAVAAAALVTAQRNPSLQTHHAGDFTLLRPDGWETVAAEVEPDELLRELRRWNEGGPSGRRLSLLELRHEHPLPPSAGMDWVTGRGNEQKRPAGRRATVQSQTMTGLLAERHGVQEDGQPLAQLLAVMTLDGRRHAVLVLEREGELRPADWRLMLRITGSLADARYRPLESAAAPLDQMHLPLPRGLAAVVPRAAADAPAADGNPPLLLVSAREPGFYVIEPRLVPSSRSTTEAMAEVGSADAPHAAADTATETLAVEQRTAEQLRLVAALIGRYVQLSGEEPPPGAVQAMQLGPRDAYALALPDAGFGSRSALWAVEIGAETETDHVMVVQLTASPGSVRQARAAARQLVDAFERA